MSASKRRIKHKIARLVRMDATRSRMQSASFLMQVFGAQGRDERFWHACMVPLGKALGRKGHRDRAMQALEDAAAKRVATGGRA